MPIWLWPIIAYVSGSIPFSLLLGWTQGVDIRKHGSGNPGATNLGRVCGKKFGLLCFVLDLLKGFIPVFAFGLTYKLIGSTAELGHAAMWIVTAAAAVVGHVFPVWLMFKGGKGVATSSGVLLGVWPVLTLAGAGGLLVWFVVMKLTAVVALASIAAAISLPVFALGAGLALSLPFDTVMVYVGVCLGLAVLVVIRHRSNIARLREGTENKAAWAKKQASPPAEPPAADSTP